MTAPAPASAPARANDWGVWVNEVGVFASRHGADRWLDFQARDRSGRLTMLWMGLAGGEWHVMCGTKEAAAQARDLFIEVGFHRGNLKVARLSACQAKVAARLRRLDEMMEAVP